MPGALANALAGVQYFQPVLKGFEEAGNRADDKLMALKEKAIEDRRKEIAVKAARSFLTATPDTDLNKLFDEQTKDITDPETLGHISTLKDIAQQKRDMDALYDTHNKIVALTKSGVLKQAPAEVQPDPTKGGFNELMSELTPAQRTIQKPVLPEEPDYLALLNNPSLSAESKYKLTEFIHNLVTPKTEEHEGVITTTDPRTGKRTQALSPFQTVTKGQVKGVIGKDGVFKTLIKGGDDNYTLAPGAIRYDSEGNKVSENPKTIGGHTTTVVDSETGETTPYSGNVKIVRGSSPAKQKDQIEFNDRIGQVTALAKSSAGKALPKGARDVLVGYKSRTLSNGQSLEAAAGLAGSSESESSARAIISANSRLTNEEKQAAFLYWKYEIAKKG